MLTISRIVRQRGIGLVELMVGITIGLIVTAGASMVAVNQISEHRRLMLETQIQQDLRTTADLLQQDLRRAGFRGMPQYSVWSPPSAVGMPEEQSAHTADANPYATVSATRSSISYQYARQKSDGSYDPVNSVKENEHFGIKWDNSTQVLFIQLGNGGDGKPNWQPITDPNNVLIIDFNVEINTQTIEVGDFCEMRCYPVSSGMTPSCPVQQVREISFKIVGQAKHDPNIKRTLTGVERIRADALSGACPS